MYREQNKHLGTNLWLLGALMAPLAHYTSGGYMAVILAVAAFLPLNLLRRSGQTEPGKAVSVLGWLWTVAVLAHLIPDSADYWAGGGKAVPLTLVILAALAGNKEKSIRSGTALFWLIIPILGLTLFLASGKAELQWLKPEMGDWTGELLITLLLPGVAYHFLSKEDSDSGVMVWTGLIAVGMSVLVQGVLSSQIALQTTAPLYEVGRMIGNGSEIIVSVGMTLSWYALCSFLLQIANGNLCRCGIQETCGRWITCLIVSGLILAGLRIPGYILVSGCVLLWVIAPNLSLKK